MVLRLGVDERGAGPPVLLLHGFTGTSRSLDGVIERLASRHRCLTVDLPGHGASPPPPDGYTFELLSSDIDAALGGAGVEAVHVLGYSMGGRAALAFALSYPRRVSSLFLIGASPGIRSASERAARAGSDAALAEGIERGGVAAFVEEWLRHPLLAPVTSAGRDAVAGSRAERLANSVAGLSGALRSLGPGAMTPLWDRLDRLAMPVVLAVGDADAKYLDVAGEMEALIPDARLLVIGDAGHAAHLDQPDRVAAAAEELFSAAGVKA